MLTRLQRNWNSTTLLLGVYNSIIIPVLALATCQKFLSYTCDRQFYSWVVIPKYLYKKSSSVICVHINLYHTHANFILNSQNCPNTQKKVNVSMNCGVFLLAIKKRNELYVLWGCIPQIIMLHERNQTKVHYKQYHSICIRL